MIASKIHTEKYEQPEKFKLSFKQTKLINIQTVNPAVTLLLQ